MKRFNILYLVVLLAIVSLVYLSKRYTQRSIMFYGFAENKEIDINFDQDIEVSNILVSPGQMILKGTPMLELDRPQLPFKLNDIRHDIDELEAEKRARTERIKASVAKLEAQRLAKIGDIRARILELESEVQMNQSLLKEMKSVDTPPVAATQPGPLRIKIEGLKKEMELSVAPLEVEIERLNQELKTGDQAVATKIRNLESELELYKEHSDKMKVEAPLDGVVGNVLCKEGEHKSAFSTLLTFYNEKPTRVKGYVHENLILEVKLKDTLYIASHQHPSHNCYGIINGLGSRIVEIPERLRKAPSIKTYGREVIIDIPYNNQFLQKEKVLLKVLNTEISQESLWKQLLTPRPTAVKNDKSVVIKK